jgi:polyisoprenoid-binding protein YceI
MRKLSLAVLTAALFIPSAFAGDDTVRTFELDVPHTKVAFKVKHLGIAAVNGSFSQLDVDLKLDPANLSTLSANVSVGVASIDTGVEKRDNHLRSEDFFDAENHPNITFQSTEVTDVGDDNTFKLHGNLTIRGTTRPIVLDAELSGPVEAFGSERIGLTATGSLDRFDYDLAWNNLVEGTAVVSKKVVLVIEAEAKAVSEDLSQG